MSVPKIAAFTALGLLGYHFLKPKPAKAKSPKGPSKPQESPTDLPTLDCGLYDWRPDRVDTAIDEAIEGGERDPEVLALHAARQVYDTTPEGAAQPWPPDEDDARAQCILDRIRIRVGLRLAEHAEDEVDDGGLGGPDPNDGRNASWPLPRPPRRPEPSDVDLPPATGPGLKPPSLPDDLPPIGDPDEPWPDYPPPAPVDLSKWTDPENYPTPGNFHQIGGPNSGTTLKKIARKALTTAFHLVLGDLDEAQRLARRSENWRAYREAINCVPWNHALFGSANQPGTPYYYDTPHGDHISLYPTHDDIAARLANGEPPQRRVSGYDPKLPGRGHHAFIWLPPLDEHELAQGRVKLLHEHWWTGDWVIMPPPEVLALGVVDVPPGRMWGCGGYETSYDYDTEVEQ